MDSYSFQSITLATLQRARQDRKIEVSCSRGDGEMEMEVKEKERRGGMRKRHPKELRRGPAPPHLGRRGERGDEMRIE